MSRRVCIVRDDRFLEHETGLVHPENPNRLRAIHRMLDKEFSRGLISIKPEPATVDDLEMVHTPGYIKKLLTTAEYDFTYLAPDTPVGAKSYLAAWLAVGGCLRVLEALMEGRCQAGFALVRPPGHHALPDRASGFCIFNNLGVTARQAQKVYGLDRILIVDWDIHHGNGLQQLFYQEKEVFYFSSQYISSFPQTGDWGEAGQGPGLGYTVNIPLIKNMGDEDMLHCYRETVGPIIRRYRPQLILVAAGFDAHARDPLGHTSLSERGFGWLTQLLVECGDEIGGPPILLALEGGYDLEALAASVREVLKALLSDGAGCNLSDMVTAQGQELAARAAQVHAEFGVWVDQSSEGQAQASGGLYEGQD